MTINIQIFLFKRLYNCFIVFYLIIALAGNCIQPTYAVSDNPVMRIQIDAHDLPRKLLYSTITIPMNQTITRNGGNIRLWYPKWVPGIHGPRGPIENVAGIVIHDDKGNVINWERVVGEVYAITANIPAKGVKYLTIDLRYIVSQPTTNSRGIDSYGSEQIGSINNNTIVLYREDLQNNDIDVEASIILPDGWKAASPMKVSTDDNQGDVHNDNNRVVYEKVTLQTFIDSPIICAENLLTFELTDPENNKNLDLGRQWIHITSESAEAVNMSEELHKGLSELVKQAGLLFGSVPFDEYHFLVPSTNELGGAGLEHLHSSYDVVGQRAMLARNAQEGWPSFLLAHEYVHAWCGKYRRPAGMVTGNYHAPKDTDMLWVYEGMTQYLGKVLEVRSGLVTPEQFRWNLQERIRWAANTQGRKWRPLSDTADSAHILRAGSKNWDRLRRDQDYYHEGALIWLETDALIRNLTNSEKSFDDFCHKFFEYKPSEPVVRGYDLGEIVRTLNDVVEYDWETFLRDRAYATHTDYNFSFVRELGYNIQFSNEPPAGPEGQSWNDGNVDARDSLGVLIGNDGNVREVLLGTPADDAGLGPGMKIVGVTEYVWSKERLLDAIAASVTTGQIDIKMINGDKYVDKVIKYNGGPRYMHLVKDESKKNDRLMEILKAK